MLKSALIPLIAIGTAATGLLLPLGASAAPVGPYASLCAAGKPAVLVRVPRVKAPRGTLSVKLYASNPATFLEKGKYLRKVEVPANRTGPFEVCVPVPSATGRYAVAVRHEVAGEKSRADGGGFSGNPKLSLLDVALKRKPSLGAVSFQVTGKTRVVPVVLNYIQGASVQPVS
ncbi:MAG TPA: DUF2141 domain-containing protein [Allosphingosinicella sp.]|jgi:uncharacterized protein (DUF2141 family)